MKKRQATSLRDLARIRRLYRSAFPLAERKPFGIIRGMQKKGKADV